MVKVSIIIPIYNVEEYLANCLNSVINQTLQNIEIICINDGSTDKSFEILENFAKCDSRIKIINQSNVGQGIARNIAIQSAQGEYIGFVDPDDWINKNMFETLYNTAKKYNCDMVEESFVIHNEPRKYIKVQKNKLNLPEKKNFNSQSIENYIFSAKLAVWNKLYKTEFIKQNNIKFMHCSRGEDIIFTVLSRALANNIIYINNADYHYRIKDKYAISPNDRLVPQNYTEFYEIFKDILIQHNIFEQIKSDFYSWVINCYYDTFRELDRNAKKIFLKEVQLFLPKTQFCEFKRKIFIKTFFNNMFSVYNTIFEGRKYKIFKICGIKLKFKYTTYLE
ncbi:glycosyltransferase [bacterium]|nr:glycosyltransferase [bacterium]